MLDLRTPLQKELDKMNQDRPLSYVEECRLKNEPVNYNLLKW